MGVCQLDLLSNATVMDEIWRPVHVTDITGQQSVAMVDLEKLPVFSAFERRAAEFVMIIAANGHTEMEHNPVGVEVAGQIPVALGPGVAANGHVPSVYGNGHVLGAAAGFDALPPPPSLPAPPLVPVIPITLTYNVTGDAGPPLHLTPDSWKHFVEYGSRAYAVPANPPPGQPAQ